MSYFSASPMRRIAVTCLIPMSFLFSMATPAQADQSTTTTAPVLATVPVPDDVLVVMPVTAPAITAVKVPPVMPIASKADVAAATSQVEVVTAPAITAPSTSSPRRTPIVAAPQIGSGDQSNSTPVAPVVVTPGPAAENPIQPAEPQDAAAPDTSSPEGITETVPQLALSVPKGPDAVWTFGLFITLGTIAGWMVHRGRNRKAYNVG